MTKKDYIKIAAVLKDMINETGPRADPHATLAICCTELAKVFAADNPRFDRTRFLNACGV